MNQNLIQAWKNDAARKAFLAAYKEWGEWLRVPELNLILFRYELSSGDTIIAMEYMQRTYGRYIAGERDRNGAWTADGLRYYIQRKGEPFTPTSNVNIGWANELLKTEKVRMQKEAKKEPEAALPPPGKADDHMACDAIRGLFSSD